MTLLEWRKLIEKALSDAGFEKSTLEAKWLIEKALNQKSMTLNPSYSPSKEEEESLQNWLSRRLNGEPLSRINGEKEFWSLPFHINAHTLDPRPETEFIVEGVLKWVGSRKTLPWRILDLGTGSGCILVSFLHELKNATGIGVDVNKSALAVARSNASLNGVLERATFNQGDWGKGLLGPYDIIVSNPPYIPDSDREILEKGVRDFDPPSALFAGVEGLDCYREIAMDIKRLLDQEGIAVLEIGYGQKSAVENIFNDMGLQIVFVLKDLAGIERVIGFGKVAIPM